MKNIAPDPEVYEKIIIFGISIKQDKFILIISTISSLFILFLGIIFQLYLNYLTLALLVAIVYFVLIFPFMFYKALENHRKSKIIDEYISFLRSLSESLSAGMTLQQALKQVSEIEYSELGKFIRKLYVWISWGIDFKKAFEMFNLYFKENKEILRANSVILETYMAGGDLSKILKTVADDIESIRDLEKFRISYLKQQVLVMYVVYVVFIGLLVGIIQIIKPMLLQFTGNIGFGIGVQPIDIGMMKIVLLTAIIMEALSIGIINGYIESNKLSSSFKHLAITFSIAVLAIILFILPPFVTIEITSPAFSYVNNLVEIEITAYVDMKPLDNVKINLNIRGPQSLSDSLILFGGKAKYYFIPTVPGTYEVVVYLNYQGNVYRESKIINIS